MCDYSLHGIRNRLAKDGETLVVHKFSTGTIGLTSQANLKPKRGLFGGTWIMSDCAVCVPPGAQLILRGISDGIRERFGVNAEEEVTFTQLSASANCHRDAVRFKNGVELLLQNLTPGQHVRVVSLSLKEETETARKEAPAFVRA